MANEYNSLGVKVTRIGSVLIIMRGVSGAGKSTKAKSLVGDGVIHSTDDLIEATGDYNGFFVKLKETNNSSMLTHMHRKNLLNAMRSMDEGITPVVIDNTNLSPSDAKPYVVYALKLGYADENIQIVDIGTNGLTAEILAERNQHGVPIEKIKKMIKKHKGFGTVTLKKILESKDNNSVRYSGVVLDEKSKSMLLDRFSNIIPDDWTKIAHHMTIQLNKGADENDLGKIVELTVIEIGVSDMAIAVRVNGYPSKNAIPHVTLAINPNGGKASMSNQISIWKPCEEFKIFGVVSNIY